MEFKQHHPLRDGFKRPTKKSSRSRTSDHIQESLIRKPICFIMFGDESSLSSTRQLLSDI